ncbi:FkbM family methyltransferase [Hyphomicrobium sp. 99]|uniref:FkbM family methyltransferase n=1 Tax=Hyphomicrobium sp. 99 TaxID=1163419 RepID=UPI0005F8855F|nr:FkbM family methyltransferase [Hyphomicrobium sp. 99]
MKQRVALAGRMLDFEGDEGDYFFQNLWEFSQGAGQRHLLQFAARHLHPASTCLEIGAGIGLATASLALACPHGHVHAFEASPKNALYLRRNMSANALTNTTVVERAVGAPSGTALRDPTTRVTIETIDDWSATLDSPLDLLKLNIEGYEAHVLAGAAETLVRDRPVIFMEFNSVAIAFKAKRSPLSFAETIWKLFDVFEIDEDGEVSTIDARLFVLNNMVRHGCVDDIVLDLKPGHDARSIRDVLATELEAERAAAA